VHYGALERTVGLPDPVYKQLEFNWLAAPLALGCADTSAFST
jgi:hypothetical protein